MNEQSTNPLRDFHDLIKEIEVEGEKFVPAQKIAALCFNYNEDTTKNKATMWVNDSYDCRMWYRFETNILQPKRHICSIGIYRNFDVATYHETEGVKTNLGMSPSNQVEIVKNLIKWGFVRLHESKLMDEFNKIQPQDSNTINRPYIDAAEMLNRLDKNKP